MNKEKVSGFSAQGVLYLGLILIFCANKPSCGEKRTKVVTTTGQVKQEKESWDKENLNNEELVTRLFKYTNQHPEDIDAQVKLAELYVSLNRFKDAAATYGTICELDPANKKYEHCKYQQILAMYKQALSLSLECDSSDLDETVRLCSNYVEENNLLEHRVEVEEIKNKSTERLLEKRISIFNFYLRRNNPTCAQHILQNIKKDFVEGNSTLIPTLLYLECKLAKYMKDDSKAQVCLQALTNDFPESEFSKMAQGIGYLG